MPVESTPSIRSNTYLLARAGRLCALPISCVIEVMRPLPLEPVPGAAGELLGVSKVRGNLVPVVDLAATLGSARTEAGRWIHLRLPNERRLALAVEQILGVQRIGDETFETLPTLWENLKEGPIESVGHRNEQLLFVLRGGRLLTEEAWNALERGDASEGASA